MSMYRALTRVLIFVLLIVSIGVFTAMTGQVQDNIQRDIDVIQAEIDRADQAYVKSLYAAYIDGLAVAGPDHPAIERWRNKLVTQTDAISLSNELHPDSVRDTVAGTVDNATHVTIDLLLRVWQRLDGASKAAQLPDEPVYFNVPVPGNSIYPSGVAPSAIDDPDIRAKYEQAIRENNQRALMANYTTTVQLALERYIRRASRVLLELGNDMPQDERERLLVSRLRNSDVQGADQLLKDLQTP